MTRYFSARNCYKMSKVSAKKDRLRTSQAAFAVCSRQEEPNVRRNLTGVSAETIGMIAQYAYKQVALSSQTIKNEIRETQ